LARYVLRRLISLTVSLAVVSVIVFALMHSAPGGPFSFEQQMPEFMMENIRRKYGLDQPIPVQYVNWVSAMLRGDFGIPFQSPTETVIELILRAWPITLIVGAISIAFAFGFGLLFGALAAFKQNSWIDTLVTFGATLGMALPSYVIGFFLVVVLAVGLGWLPTGGWGEPKHLIMPVIAFSVGPMAVIARMTRVNMLETINSEYVRLARARGIPTRLIVRRYVLKNAAVPMVTLLLPIIPDLLTGSIFIEGVFSIPGLGRFFTSSALARDYPMIMAMAMLITVLWGVTYLI
jgi:ABC-type dipeptide/oligopeptide/nickel transport system permease component